MLGKKTGGRKLGARNKATAEVKELAQQYGQEAIEALAKIVKSGDSDQAKVAACREILDRGYGKSIQGVVQLKFIFEFTQKVAGAISRVIPDSCPHCKKALTLRDSTIKELENLSKSFEDAKV